MAEPDKQQFGDGGDQWGEAARNLANAAKELGNDKGGHRRHKHHGYAG